MSKARLEIFTDAVIAIVMTILVLEIHEPAAGDFAALFAEWHRLVIYIVSFLTLAIYWGNHHHMFQTATKVNGKVLWANNFFILSLSLFPVTTSWIGDYFTSLAPQVAYGVVIMAADVMFFVLAHNVRKANGSTEEVSVFFNRYYKLWISLGTNVVALILGILITPELIFILNIVMLLLWVIPERRIEKTFEG